MAIDTNPADKLQLVTNPGDTGFEQATVPDDAATGREAILTREAFDRALSDRLLADGRITEETLAEAVTEQRSAELPLADVLVQLKLLTEAEILAEASEILDLPSVSLASTYGDATVLAALPLAEAYDFEAIPLFLVGNELTVVMSEPWDLDRLDTLRFISSKQILPAFALTLDLRRHLVRCYGERPATEAGGLVYEGGSEEAADDELLLEADESDRPVVRLVNLVLSSAVNEGATDIHFEPQGAHMTVRFRVDGIMAEKPYQIPLEAQPGVISRIKILSNIDITERRVPQDGKIRVRFEGRRIDIRVSSFPSIHGEKLVLRLLDKEKSNFTLDSIGMTPTLVEHWKEVLSCHEGIVLVTGPTGSGKSSTLFASLRYLNKPEINIVTLEDPVEYELPGITQGQVLNAAGFTFASGLRSILRQDPDVILVGEIRDLETAQIAVQAALTGHLVLATLHTNDAPSAVTRLIDLGVPTYLLASSLRGVLAQRLMRRVCPTCVEEVELEADERRRFLPWVEQGIAFVEGTGCLKCSETGYKGRTGIHELLVIDSKQRGLITAGASDADMVAVAHDSYSALWWDGLEKVRQGLSTLRELGRIAQPDEQMDAGRER